MTEKEKMLSHLLYDPNDPELTKERIRAKDLCHEFNALLPSDKKQLEILKKILIKTGKKFTVTAPFWCDYGYNIKIGEDFYANHDLVILDAAEVIFGDNVLIGPDCGFYTAGHPLDPKTRNTGLEYALPITVGKSVWIGGGTKVLPGVKIGDNSVIGAGSVVNRDIPSDCMAAGNPCRPIKSLK